MHDDAVLGEGEGARPLPAGVSMDALARAPFAVVITDASLADNPIVYVNAAFERITRYPAASALGRNCRFLQGPDTDPDHVEALRSAVAGQRQATVDILNYRADGSEFWNRLLIAPLEEGGRKGRFFLGVQLALDEEDERPRAEQAELAMREVQHRVKNHLAMVTGIIRLQGRRAKREDAAAFESVARRIENLQHLYEVLGTADGATGDTVSLSAHLGRIVRSIAALDGRPGVTVDVDIDPVEVPVDMSVKIGFLISELVTNAVQHGFSGRHRGAVTVSARAPGAGPLRIEVADDGIGLPECADWPGGGNLGSRIVRQFAQALHAELAVGPAEPTGTRIGIEIPRDRPDRG